MTCEACTRSTQRPTGLLVDGCRGCAIRDIARGPEHHEAERAGRITPAYAARLAGLGDVRAVHAEVRAVEVGKQCRPV